ncbi:uncharacterized protein B0T15DRAFT_496371 [Chaetomium strumarium]|uniref:Tetratricopeptide repeat protein n=1 Tax=Chaetomium strumarium TaxID=1170767 RepID=A0AAJ0LZW3_9PEZI|nr:hypothetical protein B0T15DRAFT_496371 [Chaetomium strumarium]
MREEYAVLDRIGSFLRRSHGADNLHGTEDDDAGAVPQSSSRGGFYNYASRAWDYHVTQIESPDLELLRQISEFLPSYQFAFWAEYSRADSGQPLCKDAVDLSGYFSESYLKLSSVYKATGVDLTMYLALLSLGDFYFDMGFPEKFAPIRGQAYRGLNDVLGPRHVLSLRAKSDLGYVRLYGGRVRDAWRIYAEVADAHMEVFGQDDIRYSRPSYTRAWQYLSAQMRYALSLAQLNQLDDAIDLLSAIRQRRRDQFDARDTFARVVQVALAEVLRMLDRNTEAIEYLLDTLEERRGTHSMGDILRLDVELALASAYSAAGMSRDAAAIVEDALLLAREDGGIGQAINLLQDTLIQAERDQTNRALLWIRLDLAALLRRRGDPDDEEEAVQSSTTPSRMSRAIVRLAWSNSRTLQDYSP